MLSRARRLEDEEGLLLLFAARHKEFFWSFFGPSQTEETTVKGQTKTAVGGEGLQTCQSVLVLSESNPDFLGNDYRRWMISASGLK